jgi:hypothetical protein
VQLQTERRNFGVAFSLGHRQKSPQLFIGFGIVRLQLAQKILRLLL